MTLKRPSPGSSRETAIVPRALFELIERTERRVDELIRLNPNYSDAARKAIGAVVHDDPAGDLAIYTALANHPEMKIAWRKLQQAFSDPARQSLSFVSACRDIYFAWEFSSKRTHAEHRAHFEQIAEDLMSVVKRITAEPRFGGHGLSRGGVSILEMVSDDTIEEFIEAIDANPSDGEITPENEAASYTRFCLHSLIPELYQYAEWIAANARAIAAGPIKSERPRRSSAARTYFVRQLSLWMNSNLGARMHEVVASVATAIFDDPISADHVRKLVTSGPEDSASFRGAKLPLSKRN